MNSAKSVVGLIVLVILLVGAYSSAYVLTEGQQAVITQFGRPIGKSVVDAGLHFKLPFIQDVRYVDKRILSWDGYPNQIPTKDKKYIIVDTTARWKIIDALRFIETVQNERGAKARLDAILDAITRDTISNHHLVEGVRNSNAILDKVNKLKESGEKEEITGEIELIKVGREQLSAMISKKSNEELKPFGISIIDVQLRRISYEKSVEAKVYERMVSERMRIAEKIRSVGKGEKAKIEGATSRDLQKIESAAYRKGEVIKGKAEAAAIAIYAKALSKDPKFYDFLRTMDAYKKSLGNNTGFILSTDSEFLRQLKNPIR